MNSHRSSQFDNTEKTSLALAASSSAAAAHLSVPAIAIEQSQAAPSTSLSSIQTGAENNFSRNPESRVPNADRTAGPNRTIASLKISPVFIKALYDNAFVTISDMAEENMSKDDIRLLAASIQEEQKVSKSETVVAILRLHAALQRYVEESVP